MYEPENRMIVLHLHWLARHTVDGDSAIRCLHCLCITSESTCDCWHSPSPWFDPHSLEKRAVIHISRYYTCACMCLSIIYWKKNGARHGSHSLSSACVCRPLLSGELGVGKCAKQAAASKPPECRYQIRTWRLSQQSQISGFHYHSGNSVTRLLPAQGHPCQPTVSAYY